MIRQDRIGDVVLATPLLRALRHRFPSAFIAAMVRPQIRELLELNPHIDQILVYDGNGIDAGRKGFWRQVRMLRKVRFDTALLLLPRARLTWIAFFARIRTRISVGLRLDQVLTATRTVSRHKYIPLRHEADYCLDLGRAIGVDETDLSVELFLSDEERTNAARLLRDNGMRGSHGKKPVIIGIHPGHGYSAPNWSTGRYVELASLLLRNRNVYVVVTGSEEERPLAEGFRSLPSKRLINLVGALGLRAFMGVISQMDLLVSASTGPMHIAAGLQIPTVSLFCRLSAASPELWGPKGNRAQILLPTEGFCGSLCEKDPHVCSFDGGIALASVYESIAAMVSLEPEGPKSVHD